jgi:hypothetical protein
MTSDNEVNVFDCPRWFDWPDSEAHLLIEYRRAVELAAFRDGRPLQCRILGFDRWVDLDTPLYTKVNWLVCDYRIKRTEEDTIASGHNPWEMTLREIGASEGYRLLEPAELWRRVPVRVVSDVELYVPHNPTFDRSGRMIPSFGFWSGENVCPDCANQMYRTKKPGGYFLKVNRSDKRQAERMAWVYKTKTDVREHLAKWYCQGWGQRTEDFSTPEEAIDCAMRTFNFKAKD